MNTDKIDNIDFFHGHSPSELTYLEVKGNSLLSEGLHEGRLLLCLPGSQAKPGDCVMLKVDGKYYYRIYRPSGQFSQFDHVFGYGPPLYFDVSRFTIEWVVVS